MRRRKNLMIGALLGVVLLMSVAYAAFSTNLEVNSTSKIDSKWDIRITSITVAEKSSGATSKSTSVSSDGLTATFSDELALPGDYIIYNVTVTNNGTLPAVLSNINVSDENNDDITYETSGLVRGTTISPDGGIGTLVVKASYNDYANQGNAVDDTSDIDVTLAFVQDDGSIRPAVELTTVYRYSSRNPSRSSPSVRTPAASMEQSQQTNRCRSLRLSLSSQQRRDSTAHSESLLRLRRSPAMPIPE